MSGTWQDETVQIDRPQQGWWREDKPTLAEQALLAQIAKDKAAEGASKAAKVAGWLWAAVAAVILVILIAAFFYALHAGGPLNGGG